MEVDMSYEAMLLTTSIMLFFAVSMIVYAVFRYTYVPESPVDRAIALKLGIGKRQTVFEHPTFSRVMSLGLRIASRFPFFRERIGRDLSALGNPSGYTVDEYLAICFTSGIVMMILSIFFIPALGILGWIVFFFMTYIGFMIPLFSLRSAAERRIRSIGRKLPYTLDLIALMMQAGANFTEAIDTIIHDDPEDDLNQELRLVRAEIDFGTQRQHALVNMADRIPLESLRGVVGAVNQAENLGTPLSEILKNQAGMLRNSRSVLAEENSAKASLKILIPTMLILLAAVLTLFSPVIVSYIKTGDLFSIGG